ncbi:MAG: DUF6314 family protein [Solirubrobacteraceae bacterium]
MPVTDPVTFLRGTWTMARTIDDHAAGQAGTVEGRATFVPAGDGLRWVEEGTMRLGDYVGDGNREMRVRPDGDAWAVDFDDGRPFHPLDLRAGRCDVEHPCRADLYRGTLWAAGPDELHVAWRIGGPAKDTTITTVYRRVTASGVEGGTDPGGGVSVDPGATEDLPPTAPATPAAEDRDPAGADGAGSDRAGA